MHMSHWDQLVEVTLFSNGEHQGVLDFLATSWSHRKVPIHRNVPPKGNQPFAPVPREQPAFFPPWMEGAVPEPLTLAVTWPQDWRSSTGPLLEAAVLYCL